MVTNIDRAALVSRNVTLKTVTLATARLDSSVDPLDEGREGGAADVRYRGRYEIRDPDHVHVFIDLVLLVTETDDETSEEDEIEEEAPAPVLELEATYQLVYTLKKANTYPEDALQFFAEINGTYNVWPYWRELAMTVSGRVGIPAVVVQVFRPRARELAPEEQETLDLGDAEPDKTVEPKGGADEVDDSS